jgi:hypothetical protein
MQTFRDGTAPTSNAERSERVFAQLEIGSCELRRQRQPSKCFVLGERPIVIYKLPHPQRSRDSSARRVSRPEVPIH